MFGMGFTEIMIIAVIAILFLGPDKLPSAMVEIAKFLRSAKNTIGSMKESIEEELNVKEMKEEALSYKKELLDAGNKVKSATDIKSMAAKLTTLDDDDLQTDDGFFDTPKDSVQQTENKPEEVTLVKKKKSDAIKEDTDV
ncbi:Sec-independent protein translocase subunit TatB [Candidatus Sulfurimonas marisnigri]|uniref:Sec-independent protein translocase protein TatB homolog n=1 Tax=Candidatus Sulfurimonas marisnigri TaxID=2740405 RepID=A0A7S7M1A9_9BACT|nr:Sec-independent protein translocase protein TatB [Candidatus Sulfurimonas marisnigri]QOY55178.1 Sec-independent protein translocase subunit TatB [Candidatus Sulfurimonas marisnigri]